MTGVKILIKPFLRMLSLTVIAMISTSCFKPPFNDFKKPPTDLRLYKTTKKHVIKELERQDIQYVEYGDTMTLVIPTDHYFLNNSAEINDICYAGLNNVVKLLKMYPKSRIYVAAFSDNTAVAKKRQHLTKARADAMLTFLWANSIPAKHLHSKGYGALFPIGDNKLIHGSAFNRRIEIQWFSLTDDEVKHKIMDSHNMK